jgi:hypothetical protein
MDDGRSEFLHILATMNNAAVNLGNSNIACLLCEAKALSGYEALQRNIHQHNAGRSLKNNFILIEQILDNSDFSHLCVHVCMLLLLYP